MKRVRNVAFRMAIVAVAAIVLCFMGSGIQAQAPADRKSVV